MEGLREFVKDCIKIRNEEYKNLLIVNLNERRVSFCGESYYVIFENGEVKVSESDLILDSLGIEFAFVFIKINYTPGFNYYKSYLTPIIINRNLKDLNDTLTIDQWVIKFNGQAWVHKPTPVRVQFMDSQSKYMEWYSNDKDGSVEGLENILKLVFIVFKHRSKTEPDYLKLLHKNMLLIGDLKDQIKNLEETIVK